MSDGIAIYDGLIQVGFACPYHKTCKYADECHAKEPVKIKHSCGLARFFLMAEGIPEIKNPTPNERE
jgi:hypothetical protein